MIFSNKHRKNKQKKEFFHEIKTHFLLPALFSLLFGALFFFPASQEFLFADVTPIFSGGGLQEGAKVLEEPVKEIGIIESGSIIATILYLIKIVLIIAGIAAFIAFIWAGFLYVTSFLNEENNETAKKVMISAAIGIIIILLAYAIVTFLTTLTL